MVESASYLGMTWFLPLFVVRTPSFFSGMGHPEDVERGSSVASKTKKLPLANVAGAHTEAEL